MSISAAMYAAVTGLSALSTGMQVISNNIANVNTVGFKAARTNFEDLISQDYWSNGKIQQIGRGVKVASVQQMFTQGSFMNSAQDTDMAIAGEGFFQVRDRVTNELMYTRAGNFTFDANGVLETPAGYVLQGWALTIPKPGAEPERIEGKQVDVKVVILCAPPVETSQIKVVANLNANDTSAYIYDKLEWAETYADQVASVAAEAARQPAADEVYNSKDGTDYLNRSEAYNEAYVSNMLKYGYTWSAATSTFYKVIRPDPDHEKLAAAAATSAALDAHVTLPYPATGILEYYDTYNTTYKARMLELGYTETSPGVFEMLETTPADVTVLGWAATSGTKAANLKWAPSSEYPTYPGYPTGSASVDAAYANAYADYLTGLGYIEPPGEFRISATNTVITSAEDKAADAAAVYGGSDAVKSLLSAAAYVTFLVGSGYILNLDYLRSEPPRDFDKTVTLAQHEAALSAASAAANLAYAADYPSNVSNGSALLFVNAYVQYLEGAGFKYQSATFSVAIPDDSDFNPALVSINHRPDASAAAVAALGISSASFRMDDFVSSASIDPSDRLRFVAEYVEFLLGKEYDPVSHPGDLYTLGASYLLPSLPDYQTDFPALLKSPTTSQDNIAVASAIAAAKLVDSTFTGYPSDTKNDVANLVYVAKYASKLEELMQLPVASTYQAPVQPTKDDFYKTPGQNDLDTANDKGIEAVQLLFADAPADYAFPSGNSDWDDAYRMHYNNHLETKDFTYQYTRSVDGSQYRIPKDADPGTAGKDAHEKAHKAAMAALDPTPGYPSEAANALYAATWDAEYKAKMLVLDPDYAAIDDEPYFTRSSAAQDIVPVVEGLAKAAAEAAAIFAGQTMYESTYKTSFDSAMLDIQSQFPGQDWLLEGMGYAGAWNGTDAASPIDPENYTFANPWTIYASLGNAHTLMVYYQPNPHMENVWDYIITCDPSEDARKDTETNVFMNGATFAGIVQKGKITFSPDGPDRHGGEIKDIEAQNIDLTRTTAARLTSAVATAVSGAVASSITNYKFGGYYTGPSVFSVSSQSMASQPRQYTLEWVGNLNQVPAVSGFTWRDDAGNTGTIPIYDKNYTGPYTFGSGLNVSFSEGSTPMKFSSGDTLTVTANSEAIGWTNLSPNSAGYFDFDVAFVQSASLSLHPPYPPGLPTITQHIALDMGARNPTGVKGEWILDEQGTTQYASESLSIFSSQDGYPAGSLQRVSIDKDGILTGIYTNGRHQPLYQIGLARFLNPWGLAKLGDNVYMETRWSGTAALNPPGYGGTGTIRANFLEQSNTDLADEIVNMIVTQRGFQANSKVVTTTDTMLAEVIEMKR